MEKCSIVIKECAKQIKFCLLDKWIWTAFIEGLLRLSPGLNFILYFRSKIWSLEKSMAKLPLRSL